MKVVVVGGGVIGLCAALYLRKSGHSVTVVDRNDIRDGCSFGNMGYISPSHFVPIATPGIIRQGLRWMTSSSSPFYIKPRLDPDLLRWCWHFWRSATPQHVEASAPHLNNLLQLSRQLMNELKQELPSFEMVERGCWMLWKKEKTGDHEKHLAEQAHQFGLNTIFCSPGEVQAREPDIEVQAAGGVLYTDDAHVNPASFMHALYEALNQAGVEFILNSDVQQVEMNNAGIAALITNRERITADEFVLANGSWMGITAKKMGVFLPMQPGKGYSLQYTGREKNLQHPAILVDHRTATTPIGSWLRIGGTMELSGHSENVLSKRVEAIYNNFKLYYPSVNLPLPDFSKAWFGYRPVTPDGMPYIGRHGKLGNVVFAGGHAMLGVSAAAATGKLVDDIVARKATPFSLTAFDPQRFG